MNKPTLKKAKKTPKQRVLKRWPQAESQWRSLYGEWQVYLEPNGVLAGIGDTPAKAWLDADYFVKRYGG